MSNKCLILAAGVGSRLHPLTEHTPKCCLDFVDGETIIQRLVRQIKTLTSVEEIVIAVGFHSDQIISSLVDYEEGISFSYNPRFASTNNMFSAHTALRGDNQITNLLVINADCVYSDGVINMTEDYESNSIFYDEQIWNDESMKVRVSENSEITDISKEVAAGPDSFVSIDLYKMTNRSTGVYFDLCDQFVRAGDTNLWNEVAIQKGVVEGALKFSGVPIGDQKWFEIDTLSDYENAKALFNS